MIEFETSSGRKLSIRPSQILEIIEGADGNAGIVLDLLDKPTVWLRDKYEAVAQKMKESE